MFVPTPMTYACTVSTKYRRGYDPRDGLLRTGSVVPVLPASTASFKTQQLRLRSVLSLSMATRWDGFKKKQTPGGAKNLESDRADGSEFRDC